MPSCLVVGKIRVTKCRLHLTIFHLIDVLFLCPTIWVQVHDFAASMSPCDSIPFCRLKTLNQTQVSRSVATCPKGIIWRLMVIRFPDHWVRCILGFPNGYAAPAGGKMCRRWAGGPHPTKILDPPLFGCGVVVGLLSNVLLVGG